MTLPSLALPGQKLAPAASFAPGSGVHLHAANLVASLPGPVSQGHAAKLPPATPSASAPRLSVARHSSAAGASTSLLPEVDSVVLARVTRLTLRQVTVEILVIDDRVCREAFQGIVRREDVRATEKDRVVVADSFRVGDIIRGIVVGVSSHLCAMTERLTVPRYR